MAFTFTSRFWRCQISQTCLFLINMILSVTGDDMFPTNMSLYTNRDTNVWWMAPLSTILQLSWRQIFLPQRVEDCNMYILDQVKRQCNSLNFHLCDTCPLSYENLIYSEFKSFKNKLSSYVLTLQMQFCLYEYWPIVNR